MQHQWLAPANPVADRAGKHLDDGRRRLGDALDQPTDIALMPRTLAMNTGSRLRTLSDAASMNRLTKPSATTPRGRRGVPSSGS